jgi:hypothetical protein
MIYLLTMIYTTYKRQNNFGNIQAVVAEAMENATANRLTHCPGPLNKPVAIL